MKCGFWRVIDSCRISLRSRRHGVGSKAECTRSFAQGARQCIMDAMIRHILLPDCRSCVFMRCFRTNLSLTSCR